MNLKNFFQFIIISFLIFSVKIYAAPDFDTLVIYSDAALTDSSINYVTLNDQFYIKITDSEPLIPTIPANYIDVLCTHTSNPAETIYLRVYQDQTETTVYKGDAITIAKQGFSNGQLRKIGITENSGEIVYLTYLNKYDTLIVARHKYPSIVNSVEFFSSSSYSDIISGSSVPISTLLYIEANGTDGSEWTIDTFPVTVRSAYGNITLVLTETSKNSGQYRNTVTAGIFTDQASQTIKVTQNSDTITVLESVSGNVADVYIQNASEATGYLSLGFKTAGYASSKTDSYVMDEVVYIEMTASDPHSDVLDYAYCFLKNENTGDTILLTLNEVSSGKFRGSAALKNYTNAALNYLKVFYGDIIRVYTAGEEVADTARLTIPLPPVDISNIRFMSSSYSSELEGNISPGATLYVEANGIDRNSLTVDTLVCVCLSTRDAAVGIQVTLTETGENTGKYQGTFRISDYSEDYLDIITAFDDGETVTVSAGGKMDTVYIQMPTVPTSYLYIDFKKNSSYSSTLTDEILPTQPLYLELIAVDSNVNTVDTVSVKVKNITSSETITVTLTETNSNSGIFRNTLSLGTETNNTLNILAAHYGDTIVATPLNAQIIADTLTVTTPTAPVDIQSLKFKDATYSSDFGDSSDAYVKLYIEMTAMDANPYFADTSVISCSSTYDSISIVLTETGDNQGIYRGYIELNNFSYQPMNYIKAYQTGETVVIRKKNYWDRVFVMTSAQPVNIVSINVKTDQTYQINKTTEYAVDDIVYVEVIAADINPLTIDGLTMEAYASSVPGDRITFNLTETDINSGRFQGTFKITSLSNDTIDELKAEYRDTVYISVKDSSDLSDTIQIKMTVPLSPLSANELKFKQSDYTSNWLSYNQVNFGDRIYVSLTATDRNELTIDTCGVILHTISNSGDTHFGDSLTEGFLFNLTLEETAKHSGVFRGSLTLEEGVSDVNQGKLNTLTGAGIVLIFGDTAVSNISYDNFTNMLSRVSDTIYTAVYDPPDVFYSISLKKTSAFSETKLSPIMWDEYLFVEVTADKTTSSNLLADTLRISIQSTIESQTDPSQDTIYELTESAVNSGSYRSSATQIYIVNVSDVPSQIGERLEVSRANRVEIKILNPDVESFASTPYPNLLSREVAYEISPTQLKSISVYRNSGYSDKITTYLSFEDDYKYFYVEVEALDLAGAGTEPYANDELQDTLVVILETELGITGNGDSVALMLKETGINTNIYRNYSGVPYVINTTGYTENELESTRPDTIYIYGNIYNNGYATVNVADSRYTIYNVENYKPPVTLRNFKIYSDNGYSNQVTSNSSLLIEDYVYIEAEGINSASILQDTKQITVHRNLSDTGYSPDSITVILTETAVGSEKYRISGDELVPQLYYSTQDIINYLKASGGDTIYVTNYGDTTIQAYFKVGYFQPPTTLYLIKASLNSSYSEYLADSGILPLNSTIYLEATGDYGNDATIDTVLVKVYNKDGETGDTIYLRLVETAKKTGKYRGSFKLSSITNNTLYELGVNSGDEIRIEINDSPTVSIMLFVVYILPSGPTTLSNLLFMKTDYESEQDGFAAPNSVVYVEANGLDGSQYSIDTMSVSCTSTKDPAGIRIELTETDLNTGKYRGTFTLNNFSDDIVDYLDVNSVDSVYILATNNIGGETKTDEIKVFPSTTPDSVTSVDFKIEGYESSLIADVLPTDNLYIEAVALDLNPNTYDTLLMYLLNVSEGETLTFILNETENGSGRFRASVQLDEITNQTQVKLKAEYGDTLIVVAAAAVSIRDTIFVTVPKGPVTLDNLRLMKQGYSGELDHNILPGSTLYVEANGNDGNEITADTLICHCTSTIDTLGINIVLTETGSNTGKYRGTFSLYSFSDTDLKYLKAEDSGTLIVISSVNIDGSDSKEDSVSIQMATSPISILDIDFKQSGYGNTLTDKILPNTTVYIEAVGIDENVNTVDTALSYLGNGISETITLTLTEIGINSGKYRGTAYLSNITSQQNGTLKANYGDNIFVYSYDYTRGDTVVITNYKIPLALNNIYFMSSTYSSELTGYISPGTRLYIEANGVDANSLTADTLTCVCTSSEDPVGITVTLTETGVNTGKYRGTFKLMSYTDDPYDFLKAEDSGVTIIITATDLDNEDTVSDSVTIQHPTQPSVISNIYFKNSSYSQNLEEEVLPNSTLYIEAIGQDMNPNTSDTLTVYLINENISQSNSDSAITLVLNETNSNSGRFRGNAYLSVFTDLFASKLKTDYGDSITVRDLTNPLIYDSVLVTFPKQPLVIYSTKFMSSDYNSELSGFISTNSYLYVEVLASDSNSLTADTVVCFCSSTESAEVISVILNETSSNTGRYRGRFKLMQYTEDELDYLEAEDSGTLITVTAVNAVGGDSQADSVQIRLSTVPTSITNILFKTSDYSEKLNTKILPTSTVYIEVLAQDLSPTTSDTLLVSLININSDPARSDSFIMLVLNETNSSSGRFRASASLSTLTDQLNLTLKAGYGDTIIARSVSAPGLTDTAVITVPALPVSIYDLRYMSSGYNLELTGSISPNSTLYVELLGVDGNSLTIDTVVCFCSSTESSRSIRITLTETGYSTGRYQGNFHLASYTEETLAFLEAEDSGTIIKIEAVSSNGNDTKTDTIVILSSIQPIEIYSLFFKTSNYQDNLTGDILPDDYIYIEVLAEDLNASTADSLTVNLVNTTLSETITFSLIETSNNTGKFRGSAKLGSVTNQTTLVLHAEYGNEIKAVLPDSPTANDTVNIAVPLSPVDIQSLKFMNEEYTSVLGDSTDAYVKLYIELTATDRNEYIPDTINVSCTSTYNSIQVTLTETEKNSGIFRGYIELNNFSYQKMNYIKAYITGDTVVISTINRQDMINVMTTAEPSNIVSINVKTKSDYKENKVTDYTVDDIVYVEVFADDGNPLTIDGLTMQAYSSSNTDDRINFTLTETEINSGKFRGLFKITTLSNDTIDELKAQYGDTVYITVPGSADINDTITIKMTIPKSPIFANELKFKQSNYTDDWLSYEQVNFGENIYVSLTATDQNELTVDTAGVILHTVSNNGDTNFNDTVGVEGYLFNLTLQETGKHTGVFRGNLTLDESLSVVNEGKVRTRTGAGIILFFGDTLTTNITPAEFNRIIGNSFDTIYTAVYNPPTEFYSISLKKTASFSESKLSPVKWGEYLYVEATADKTTSSNLLADTVRVTIQSTSEAAGDTEQDTVYILTESEIHSGIYRSAPEQIYVVSTFEAGYTFTGGRLEVGRNDWVEIKILRPDTMVYALTPVPNSFLREVAYEISPTKIKSIRTYRNAGYSDYINTYVSFEEEYKYFYIELEAYDIEGAGTMPYANDELEDTVIVIIKSDQGLIGNGDSVSVVLKETGVKTNIYRNYSGVPYILNSKGFTEFELEASRPDDITIYGNVNEGSAPIYLKVENYRPPTALRNFKIYSTNSYNSLLSTDLLIEDYVYIEAEGVGSAEILKDTATIVLYRNLSDTERPNVKYDTVLNIWYSDSIEVVLTETEVGSEKYRVSGNELIPQLYYSTEDEINYIKVEGGDTISITSLGDTDIQTYFNIGYPRPPSTLYLLKASRNSNYSEYLPDSGILPLGSQIFVEATGDYGNDATVDTVRIRVINIDGNTGDTIYVNLTETDKKTGVYRGSLKLSSITNNTLFELGVKTGDELILEIADSPTVNIKLFVVYIQPSGPTTLNNVLLMKSDYKSALDGFVTPNSTLYVEANGLDGSQYSIDTMTVFCTSTKDPAGIKIELTETDLHTGEYQGAFTLNNFSDDIVDYLKVASIDTVYITATNNLGGETKTDIIKVFPSTTPDSITSIDFKESGYTFSLTDKVLPDDKLYIEAVGSDLNANTVDTLLVHIENITGNETVTFSLMETEINSGRFRGTVQLGDNTNQTLIQLKANYGDTIIKVWTAKNPAVFDTVSITIPSSPVSLDELDFMNSQYTGILEGFILPGSIVNMEADGNDGNKLTIDTLTVICTSSEDAAGVKLELTETDKNSGKYRGELKISSFTDQGLGILEAEDSGTIITIYSVSKTGNDTKTDSVKIQIAGQPSRIADINFKTSNYQNNLTVPILPTADVYVEVIGLEGNINTRDTTAVYLGNGISDTIILVLTETSNNSGKFRGSAKLTSITNQSLYELKAGYGDIIIVQSAADTSKQDILNITVHTGPVALNNLSFVKNDYSSEYEGDVPPYARLYIQANGTDGNSLTVDTLTVSCTSSVDSKGISVILTETSENSGKYQGQFDINNYSNDTLDYLKAYQTGHTIWIMAADIDFQDTKYDSVVVQGATSPVQIIRVEFKEQDYTTTLDREILFTEKVYVEILAIDKNPNTSDTILVFLVNNNIDSSNLESSIPIIVTESGNNTGKYQFFASLGVSTNSTLKILRADKGDSIEVSVYGVKDVLYITKPKPPVFLSSLKFMSSDYTSVLDENSRISSSDLHIEANGEDANVLTVDTIACTVLSYPSGFDKPDSITVTLTETGSNTGRYRGEFSFRDVTNDTLNYIKAVYTGDTINIHIGKELINRDLWDTFIITATYLAINTGDNKYDTLFKTTVLGFSGKIGDVQSSNTLKAKYYSKKSGETLTVTFDTVYTTSTDFYVTIEFDTDGAKTVWFIAYTQNNELPPTTSETITVNLDVSPPKLVILTPINNQMVQLTDLRVSGRTSDTSDIVKIILNGDTSIANRDINDSMIFYRGVQILQTDKNRIDVLSQDTVGNTSFKTVFVKYISPAEVTIDTFTAESEDSVVTVDKEADISYITFGSKDKNVYPEKGSIKVTTQDEKVITLKVDFNDTSAPVSLIVRNSSYKEVSDKLVNAKETVDKFGTEEDYEAGMSTVREYNFYRNGDTFNNIAATIIFEVPDRLKGARNYTVYQFIDTGSYWLQIPPNNVINHGDTVEAHLEHFSIYGLFLTGDPVKSDLTNVEIFPNPFIPGDGLPYTGIDFSGANDDAQNMTGIHIINLTGNNTIEIYTVNGRLVRRIKTGADQARYIWDTKNSSGKYVTSGMYLILIKDPGKTVKKITIIR